MKVFTKENLPYWLGAIIVLFITCFVLIYFSEAQIPSISASSGIVAIISAILAVLLTVFVTSILLKHQSETEGEKERSMKVFEKKQEIYHNFLQNLKEIIQSGEIRIGVKTEDNKIDRTVDDLKDLIFQLCYLQMHTDEEKIKNILSYVADIIQIMNDFNSTKEENKQKNSSEFYSKLSEKLFEIVTILKADLYHKESKTIPQEYMSEILKKCDLFVETTALNKYETQIYFWKRLIIQLKNIGYEVECGTDITQMVNDYYSKTRPGWSGITLKAEEGIWISISCEGREFFYGIPRESEWQENAELEERIKKVWTQFKTNKWWYAWKYPDRNMNLDFWDCSSPEFEDLKNPRKRDKFIGELAEEINRYVEKFRETI